MYQYFGFGFLSFRVTAVHTHTHTHSLSIFVCCCVGWTAEAARVACMRFYGMLGRDQGGPPDYSQPVYNHHHNNNNNNHQNRPKGQNKSKKKRRGGKNNRNHGNTGNAKLVSVQCAAESLGHSEPTFEFTGECSEITYEPAVDSQADALFDPVCEEHTGDSRDSMDSMDTVDSFDSVVSVDSSSDTQGTYYGAECIDQWVDLFAHFARLPPNNFVENPNFWNRCTVHNRIEWEPDV